MGNAGLSKTKRRIQSVSSTKKITSAMEMIASVKLRHFQKQYEEGKNFEEKCRDLMAELFLHDRESGSHYGRPNENAEGFCYILLTSNMGLCAGYNSELYKFIDERLAPGDTLMTIGSKGAAHYKHNPPKGVHLDISKAGWAQSVTQQEMMDMTTWLRNSFNNGQFKRIYLVYTSYVNSLTHVPYRFQLLPVQMPHYEGRESEAYCPLKFEPEARVMIHRMMPFYLSAMLHHRFNEAHLAEQAARRTAMDQANDNADEIIEKLTIEYNKARQGAITQELIEVVTGSNAQM